MDPIPDITSTIVDGNLVSSHPSDSLWWTQAEDPWQFLATTRELCRILNSSDPADYPSCLSVHQDGSCNGLQHYAALGRDFGGGQAVNLTPSDKPQDVYSKVLSFVNQRLEADAAGLGDSINTEFARALLGKVNRKTIKQTVMTSVYGVTFIGARDQILKQLDDRMDINWNVDEDKRYRVCFFFANVERYTHSFHF
jgi:DNA-directed RNA polymerase